MTHPSQDVTKSAHSQQRSLAFEAEDPASTSRREALSALLIETAQRPGTSDQLQAGWLETPLGDMLAVADQTHLHLLEFADRPALPRELDRLRKQTHSTIRFGCNALLTGVSAELEAYFTGRSAAFSTPIAYHGTPFTCSVWRHLLTIPPAATQSYLGLSQVMGQPTALRAVARANGANQIAIIVPCHRVIGQDGSLTGYAGGLWRKQWLLEHEQRCFSPEPKHPR